jgi:hypothetical protein
MVYENTMSRTAVSDRDAIVLNLRAGWNTLLAKVVNQAEDHGLVLRLSAGAVDLARDGQRVQARPEALGH